MNGKWVKVFDSSKVRVGDQLMYYDEVNDSMYRLCFNEPCGRGYRVVEEIIGSTVRSRDINGEIASEDVFGHWNHVEVLVKTEEHYVSDDVRELLNILL